MYQAEILKSLITNPDADISLINRIDISVDMVFTEPHISMFEVIKQYVLKFGKIPSIDYLESYLSIDSPDSKAKESFTEITNVKELNDVPEAYVDFQIKYRLKQSISDLVDEFKINLKTTSMGDIVASVSDLNEKTSMLISTAEANNKDIINMNDDKALAEEKAYVEEEDKSYFLSNFDITPLDNSVGGVKDGDQFLGILASAKNYKSTLLRFMVYKQILQGINTYFISLEMSVRSIKEHFYVLHANNTEIWGMSAPVLTINKIRRKTWTKEEKEFYLKVVEDFTTRKGMGDLIIMRPRKQYDFASMVGDVTETMYKYRLKGERLHLLVIDYLTLILPKLKGRNDISEYNDMIKLTRMWGLENKIAIWSPIQSNRSGFKTSRENSDQSNLKYDLSHIGMYSEFEKSATDIIYTLQSPEMKETDSVKIGSVLHRESPDMVPTILQVNPATGYFYEGNNKGTVTQEDAIDIIQNLEI